MIQGNVLQISKQRSLSVFAVYKAVVTGNDGGADESSQWEWHFQQQQQQQQSVLSAMCPILCLAARWKPLRRYRSLILLIHQYPLVYLYTPTKVMPDIGTPPPPPPTPPSPPAPGFSLCCFLCFPIFRLFCFSCFRLSLLVFTPYLPLFGPPPLLCSPFLPSSFRWPWTLWVCLSPASPALSS